MTGNLSNGVRVAAFLLITSIVLAGGCDRPRSMPPGATAAPHEVSEVSPTLIGKQVTIRGRFSLAGKPGSYVLLDHQQEVFLEARTESFSWEPYNEMDGKLVAATGTLRFYHKAGPVDETRQQAPDHYYFEAETTQLRPISH